MTGETVSDGGDDSGTFASWVRESASMADQLLTTLPALDHAAEGVRESIRDWIGVIINAPAATSALSLAASQSANETLDLLVECVHGRGRPALKACRSLFELLLTVKDVIADPDARERYEEHRWVAFGIASDIESRRPALKKGDLHWRRKTERLVRPEYDRVLAKYGDRFRRGWRSDTLASAAERHGMTADYDYYRLSSVILHGSSGGVLGQYLLHLSEADAKPVYRTGLALTLCPEALERGTRYFRATVAETKSIVGAGATFDLLAALSELRRAAADYRRYIEDLDEQWWKNIPRGTIMAVAAVSSLGSCRWYMFDTSRQALREAITPSNIPTFQHEALEEIVAARKAGRGIPGVDDSELVTVTVIGIRLLPKEGSRWRPAGELLQQPAAGAVTAPLGFDTILRSPGWLSEDDESYEW